MSQSKVAKYAGTNGVNIVSTVSHVFIVYVNKLKQVHYFKSDNHIFPHVPLELSFSCPIFFLRSFTYHDTHTHTGCSTPKMKYFQHNIFIINLKCGD